MTRSRPGSSGPARRRRKSQGGQELLEFALLLVIWVPLFLGSFVTGLNLIRSTQTNQMVRDLTDMYIHGADFSTYPMQQVAQRLGRGLNLQIGASFPANQQTNTSNGGDVLVTVTQVVYVGTTADANCVAVGASNCTNHDKFVFTERMLFGNGSLASAHPSSLGDPGPTAVITASGIVQNYVKNSDAALPGAAQTAMQNLWQVSGGGRTPLTDGRAVYIVESYVQNLNLGLGNLTNTSGIYARYFF